MLGSDVHHLLVLSRSHVYESFVVFGSLFDGIILCFYPPQVIK